MVWTLSNILSVLVILIVLIDIIYRIKHHHDSIVVNPAPKKDSAFKEIFRDFKQQLSFTRVATAVVILGIFIAIGVGWYWPHLQDYCKNAFDKLLDFAKMLFGLGKAPEAIAQATNIFKAPAPESPIDPPNKENNEV